MHQSGPFGLQNLCFISLLLFLCLEPYVAALETYVRGPLLTSEPMYLLTSLSTTSLVIPQSIPQTATKEIQEVSLIFQLHWHSVSNLISMAHEVLPDVYPASPSDFIICAPCQ